MFEKIIEWVRGVLNKMLAQNDFKKAFGVDVVYSEVMANAITQWAQMYKNQPEWLNTEKGIVSMNLPASIASEVASTVILEMQVSVTGSARAEWLHNQLDYYVNNPSELRKYVEVGLAKGGLIIKPYITPNGSVAFDFVQADQFYPISFDASGRLQACVFSDQKTVGNIYYTRLEFHSLQGGVYTVRNTAWRSTSKDALGNQVALSAIAEWASLEPEQAIQSVSKPLFGYFKTPFSNNIDSTSPLGVSVFSRGVEFIKQADEFWSNFLWEYESAKRALYTDVEAFQKNKATGKPELPDKRLYRLLDLQTQIGDKGLFEDWSPSIRQVEILAGLDAILRRIEFACGLSYGVLSNPQSVALTATEIKASKQRYYVTVSNTQKALERALTDLVDAMNVYADLYSLAPQGTYSINYAWDDSIIADHDTQFQQDSQALGQRTMSRYQWRMRQYGEDEITAKKRITEIDAEASENKTFTFTEE